LSDSLTLGSVEVPRVRGEVVGFRSWKIGRRRSGAWALFPAGWGGVPDAWPLGTVEAKCGIWFRHDVPHQPPVHDCGCGLHARFVPEFYGSGSAEIVGAVVAWGRMEVAWDGFRAEFMRVVALADEVRTGRLALGFETLTRAVVPDVLRELAWLYDARVVPLSGLRVAASEHGIEVPLEVRPSRPEVARPASRPTPKPWPVMRLLRSGSLTGKLLETCLRPERSMEVRCSACGWVQFASVDAMIEGVARCGCGR
jgi:hypothetical protein